jgi:hypothetical protein
MTHPGGPPGSDGLVASFEVHGNGVGSVFLSATARVRVPNWQPDAGDATCNVESQLSHQPGFTGCAPGENCRLHGYAQTPLRGSLTDGQTDAAQLTAWQTVSRVLPLKEGVNTYYLLGNTDCPEAVWGTVTLGILQVE